MKNIVGEMRENYNKSDKTFNFFKKAAKYKNIDEKDQYMLQKLKKTCRNKCSTDLDFLGYKKPSVDTESDQVRKDLHQKHIALLEIKSKAKFKVDDRWSRNPFVVYQLNHEKTKVNYIQQNMLQLKNNENPEKNVDFTRIQTIDDKDHVEYQ